MWGGREGGKACTNVACVGVEDCVNPCNREHNGVTVGVARESERESAEWPRGEDDCGGEEMFYRRKNK